VSFKKLISRTVDAVNLTSVMGFQPFWDLTGWQFILNPFLCTVYPQKRLLSSENSLNKLKIVNQKIFI